MINFKWKKVGLITGLTLSLIVAGCGSNDGNAQADATVSEKMEYTITGTEPGAGQTEKNEEALVAYENLAGWKQDLSSAGAMLTQLSEAIDNEEPIVFSAWSPHYKFAKWDLKYLEDPQGIYGEDEQITTIVKKDLKNEMPEAYTIIDRFPAIMFEAIATGDADASLAVWMPSTHAALYDEYEGDFEDIGPNLNGAKVGLAVPSYMDIDSIEDLQPKE
ncbi:hypothetical protein CIL05_09485 [Virgibacillus profundi]|uniref:ABC-type glycine betaine transport system substrate-binding domain-containing protein n=1 Tax=Virgibacillus profundi TaxID=2024555 RepID=A0A2A2IEL4_9BACI|nr:glycine betaine ABC transporter substrate-binding protein [Virgibacillus profundi]PAV29600.1 hypothetical protein CIL05_09485 [Virgibacillus profundi]PXY53772.1 hypothetical protein CIT14_09575 [Virgibacillus profundi]